MNRRTLLSPGGAAATTSLIAPYEVRYKSESSGQVAHATLSRLAHDPGLLAAIRSGSTTVIETGAPRLLMRRPRRASSSAPR
jgi:hypothetical protein